MNALIKYLYYDFLWFDVCDLKDHSTINISKIMWGIALSNNVGSVIELFMTKYGIRND